ncbi:MAG: hypothetical protein SGJ01_19245 [Gemmatimonadota bacterium]|nr:hypothetical protein [Gemmatimonadota bacterium]MDZ4865556.1 hypothetical protein [Gemmatimonadota bacterium]
MTIKLPSEGFENQSFGTKMGFIASAWSPERGAGTQSYFLLAGSGKQRVACNFPLHFHQETGSSREGGFAKKWHPNGGRGGVMKCGGWHHWEIVMELNQLGQANGTVRWWLDGEPVLSYDNLTYVYGENTNGFLQWKWNPTWGGTGGVRTRPDDILIDHVYMSGVPYDGPRTKAGPRRPNPDKRRPPPVN